MYRPALYHPYNLMHTNTLMVHNSNGTCTYISFHKDWTGRTQKDYLTDCAHTKNPQTPDWETQRRWTKKLDLSKHFIALKLTEIKLK